MAVAVGLAVAVAEAVAAAVEAGMAVTIAVGTGVTTAGLPLSGLQAANPSVKSRLNPNRPKCQTERLLNRQALMLLPSWINLDHSNGRHS